jgi:DNA-binding CsgD family transcriptional regulator/PAS domain-containing protein
MPGGLLSPQVIELLYQAPLEPELWPRALAALLPSFRSKHASFFIPAEDGGAPLFVQHGFSDAELKIQFSPEAMRCLKNWQAYLPAGQVVTNRHFMSKRDWERSEAYNEYVRHSGVYHGALFRHDAPGGAFHFSICRPGRNDPYSDEELATLREFSSHLGGALRLRQKFDHAARQVKSLQAALDRLSDGALIVNARGVPLFANARAQQLLDRGEGLICAAAGLKAQHLPLTQQLAEAIQTASDPRWTGDLHLSLPRQKPRLPLLLDFVPLSQLEVDMRGAGDAAVLIFVKEPDAPFSVSRQGLTATLRFTPREIDVAALLAEGVGTEAAASRLGISVGTVRFHIKRMFQKTGVHSQASLVSLIRSFGVR